MNGRYPNGNNQYNGNGQRTRRPSDDVRRTNNSRSAGQQGGQASSQAGRQTGSQTRGQVYGSQYDRRLTDAERKRRLENRVREVERRRADRRRRLFHVIITLVLYAVLFCALALAVSFSLKNIGKRDGVTFIFGEGDATSFSGAVYSDGGEMLINMNDLAAFLGLSTTGDSGEIRYIADGGEEIRFTVGSRSVTVNGVPSFMATPSVMTDSGLAVPYSFIRDSFTGLDFTEEEDGSKITVTRGNDVSGGQLALGFVQKSDSAIETESEENALRAGSSGTTVDETPVFSTDLSEYEMYMSVNDKKYLLLVNRENALDADYVPDELTDVVNTRGDRAAQKMCLYAEKALEALFIEMKAAGFTDVSVTSGYRSYATQKYLYEGYVTTEMSRNSSLSKDEAQTLVDKYSARPGTSEHQSGLCCDMHNLASADQSFKNQPAYKWLCDNAYKFGFILRFPEGKEDITGYDFEPWHFRFVGRYHAAKIHNSGMCLEEYVASLK